MWQAFKNRFAFVSMPLAVLWCVVYLNGLVFFSGLGGNDGWGYYANLESLLIDHDWRVINNIHAYGDDGQPLGVLTDTEHAAELGGAVTYYPWGHTLYYAIPFMAATWIDQIFEIEFPSEKLPKDSPYYGQSSLLMLRVVAMVLWTELLTLVLISLLFLTAQQMGASKIEAFFATLAAWLSSPLPFYANNVMSHVSSCLFLAFTFWSITQPKAMPFRSGCLAGFFALARTSNALVIGPLAIFMWFKGKVPAVLRCVLGFFCVFSFCLVSWTLLNGHPLEPGAPFNPGRVDWSWPIYNVLLDPRHGYFLWFPAALPACYFLIQRARRSPRYWTHVALAFMFVLLISARHEYWSGGSFGQRYLCVWAVLLLPGFLDLYRQWWGGACLLLCLPWSVFLYFAFASKQLKFDELTGEMGLHIANYFVVFEKPIAQWPALLFEGSHTLPLLLSQPWILLLSLSPLLIFLHIGYWWGENKAA